MAQSTILIGTSHSNELEKISIKEDSARVRYNNSSEMVDKPHGIPFKAHQQDIHHNKISTRRLSRAIYPLLPRGLSSTRLGKNRRELGNIEQKTLHSGAIELLIGGFVLDSSDYQHNHKLLQQPISRY
jgi:hypothetical protein